MKIVNIVGARPQFVKAAMVSRAVRGTAGMREILVHTGQHYDAQLSEIFFAELDLPRPDYALGVGSGTHGAQTGRMLEGIERVLLDEQPDWVLVYGDCNTTLAGALAASKLHIPVAHIEAGMRSYLRHSPEEINRVLTDHLADLLFPPLPSAVEHLRQEGIAGERVQAVGDVMYDAARYYAQKAERESTILAQLGLSAQEYLLATIHRAENTDDPERLQAIIRALLLAAKELPVVMPLHPRTRSKLAQTGLLPEVMLHLRVLPPVGYLEMVMLERSALAIATDSGGLQKEAVFHRVPCITLREETEYPELVALGCNRLVWPPTAEALVAAVEAARTCTVEYGSITLFGDGRASQAIANVLARLAA